MSSQQSRGLLIVVEGLDRSGKTSQCQLLLQRLKDSGVEARYVKFPDRSTLTGQMINNYLTGQAQQDDHSIHLLFSANRWEAIKGIQEDLFKGVTVIVDRYSFSGAVYSAAKDNPDLSLEWAWSPEVGLLEPDLTVFLDISSQAAAKRGGYGAERYETEKMQTRVRSLFKQLFTYLEDVEVCSVDAGRMMDEVTNDIALAVEQAMQTAVADTTLRKLKPLRCA